MKRLAILLIALLLVSFSVSMIFGSDDKVKFSADGKKMEFPDKDGIPDADISDIVFDLKNILPEVQFMKGKIYRGWFSSPLYKSARWVNYIFLTKCDTEAIEFFLSMAGTRGKQGSHYTLTCPPRLTSDFSCTLKDRVGTSKITSTYRFTIKNGKPAIDSSSGNSAEYEEMGVLPGNVLHK